MPGPARWRRRRFVCAMLSNLAFSCRGMFSKQVGRAGTGRRTLCAACGVEHAAWSMQRAMCVCACVRVCVRVCVYLGGSDNIDLICVCIRVCV